ncbi:lipoyl(octanoyl) transferase LipB [Liberibacter sp. Z1]|nr:lipoyl(octanoyl) transferase LipB [Candidatus Liberibacter sp.]
MFPEENLPPVRWWTTDYPIPYEQSHKIMEHEVQSILDGAAELVWLLEHPPLYTSGTSALPRDLLCPDRFPIYPTGRGGSYTYHGPGQRIVYVILNLKKRRKDLRCFVVALEEIIIQTLKKLGICGERREDRVGIWVARPENKTLGTETIPEYKIAALGIRVRRWITFHGFALNISPDLSHFSGIVPCGIRQHGVTSLKDLGKYYPTQYIDTVLRESFENIFGLTTSYEDKRHIIS